MEEAGQRCQLQTRDFAALKLEKEVLSTYLQISDIF